MRSDKSWHTVLSLAAVLVIASACSGSGGEGMLAPEEPGEFVLRLDSQYLERVNGPIPEPLGELTLGMPGATEREQDLIVGAEVSVDLAVSQLDTFTTIYAAVSSLDNASQADHHYRANLSGQQSIEDLIIGSPATLDQGVPYALTVAVGSADGRISETRTLVMAAVEPGTTDLTVTLTWTNPTNLNLRLIEPSYLHPEYGNFIDAFNGNTSSTGGGFVGRPASWDSNSVCNLDGRNQESIIYEAVRPRSGDYRVSVIYQSDCGTGPENFTVTIQNGDKRQVNTGTVRQEGDVADVATFRRE